MKELQRENEWSPWLDGAHIGNKLHPSSIGKKLLSEHLEGSYQARARNHWYGITPTEHTLNGEKLYRSYLRGGLYTMPEILNFF